MLQSYTLVIIVELILTSSGVGRISPFPLVQRCSGL